MNECEYYIAVGKKKNEKIATKNIVQSFFICARHARYTSLQFTKLQQIL